MTLMTEGALLPTVCAGDELAPGYTVIEHVSRNQALDVYDVWDDGRYCRCVAKTLRPDRLGEKRATARLRLEGELLARFAHPHLVRAYETLETPQTVVVLETLSGETLAAHIEQRASRMPAAELALLGLQVGSAVRYMHGQGYLHIDLKPSNIILDLGVAKVLDLSLARPPGPLRPGVGTRCYLAPEQARGEEATPAADVYALGVVIYQLLTGRLPWEGSTLAELAIRRENERPLPPTSYDPDVPETLSQAVLRSLEGDAGARYSSARELSKALQAGLAGHEPPAPSDEMPTNMMSPRLVIASVLITAGSESSSMVGMRVSMRRRTMPTWLRW